MNRRSLFGKIGAIAAGVALVPVVKIEAVPTVAGAATFDPMASWADNLRAQRDSKFIPVWNASGDQYLRYYGVTPATEEVHA